MNLRTKKQISARVLGVGLEKVVFDESRLSEINEALTRQDIRDLAKSGAIKIKPAGGRRKKEKRKTKRRAGKIRKKVRERKRDYITLTRNLRKIAKALKKAGAISKKQYFELRKKIKAKAFKSRAHLMEGIKR